MNTQVFLGLSIIIIISFNISLCVFSYFTAIKVDKLQKQIEYLYKIHREEK